MVKHSLKHRVKKVPSHEHLIGKYSFSNTQLLIFILAFAAVGYLIFKSFAAGNSSFSWDTQTDFQAGTLSNTVATSAGSVTLLGGGSGSAPIGKSLPDYTVDFETPGNYSEGPGEDVFPGVVCNTSADVHPDAGAPLFQSVSSAFGMDSSTAAHGSHSAHVNAPPGARASYSCAKEDVHMNLENWEVQGDEVWIGFSYKLPTDWQGSVGWGRLLEWIANAHFFPSFGTDIFNINDPNNLTLTFHTGLTPNPGSASLDPAYNKQYVILGSIGADDPPGSTPPPETKNVWHTMIVHVLWESGNDPSHPNGVWQVWHREQGQSGFQEIFSNVNGDHASVQVAPFPTAMYNTQYGTPGDQSSNPNDTGNHTEWGIYSANTSWTRSYWLDDVIRRSSATSIMQNYGVSSLPGIAGGTLTYPASGTATLTHDFGSIVDWASAAATDTKPSSTNITYQYRSSIDNSSWTAWTSDVTTLANGRYLQAQATLTTSNSSVTPSLDKLTVTYDPVAAPGQPSITQNIIAGQTLSGTVTWTANVTSNASSISKIEFAMDGNTNNTTVNTPGPYQRVLDTTKLTAGTHNIGLTVTLTDGTVVWQPYQIGNVTVNNTVTPPPPPDTTPPTVSLTSPAPGATVSGSSVNVSATANDNDVVASVQFQLDGGNLGPLYTASPYATTLNTTTLANGNHTLSAIAKDASGNSSPPASITINVNNVTIPPPDTQAPTTPASLHSTGTTSSSITLAWNASSDTGGSGLAGYKLYRNGALITQTTSLSYTDTGLTANTGYLYKISAIDNAGNESGQSLAVNVSTANVVTTPTITQNLTGGQTLSGTVTWTASVTSGASSISKIEFAMDGNTNNTTVNAPGPYQRILDTTKLTNSTHNLGLTVTLTDGTVVWQPYQIGNVTVSNTTSPPQPPPPPPVTPGSSNPDLDGNGIVDIFDLSKLLSNYGKSGVGDLDGNGIVDIFDLSRLLAQYKG
jgi:hypothetical protein